MSGDKRGLKLMLACTATCIAIMASAQETVSLGVTGIQRFEIPPAGGVNFIGFNFTSTEPLYLEDVFGTNQLTQSFLPTMADRVYLWNGSTYDIFFQKTDGLFYNGANISEQKTAEVKPGTALFIQSPSASTDTNTIWISGSVSMTPFESQVYEGLVAIANPYPTAMELNSTNFDWSAATSGILPTLADNVYIWNPNKETGPGYDVYFLKPDGKWYEGKSPFPLGNPVIPVGGGAFYQAKNSFTNDVVRPFPEL